MDIPYIESLIFKMNDLPPGIASIYILDTLTQGYQRYAG